MDKPLNGYVALWAGRRAEIYADSLYAAKQKAIAMWGVRKPHRHMVSVMLAERAGEPVVHGPAEL